MVNSKKLSAATLVFLSSSISYAATPSLMFSGNPSGNVPGNTSQSTSGEEAGTPLVRTLRAEIEARPKGSDFNALLSDWQEKYGTLAVQPLFKIARDSGNADSVRYIALMGVAKLGGRDASTIILPLLRDSSWMLRSGALRALAALGNRKSAEAILPLLHDPALTVRLEAVDAVERLEPAGSGAALALCLNDPENFHGGKALWVPQRALKALAKMRAHEAIPKVALLLDRGTDQELQKTAISTLEVITGKTYALKGESLTQQIAHWKMAVK
jgi:HEAT repeat protein